ncbi:MAG: lamin tail domain-containing protein [Nitrosopumilaceae archaeon]
MKIKSFIVISFCALVLLLSSISNHQVFGLRNVVINEFELNPPSYDSGNEWVELFNPTNSQIDIGGWIIWTTHGEISKYTIPAGTLIDSGGFYVIRFPGQFLDNEQESVILFDSKGAEIDKSRTSRDAVNDARTWQRSGDDDWVFKNGTPNSANPEQIRKIPSIAEPHLSKETTKTECKGKALCITGTVKRIIDGDTLFIEPYVIRLSLVNAPEKTEHGFNEAKIFTSDLCPRGSTITVDQDDKQPRDKYKRIVGMVHCSGKILNSELLQNGHAKILVRYCSESEFAIEPWAKAYGC